MSAHPYVMSERVKERVIRRQGRLHAHERIAAKQTALVVVDMQNYFVADGFGACVPLARAIVPAINRMAAALRAAGGLVVWVQTTAVGATTRWRRHHEHMLTPERVERRLQELDEKHPGFALYPALEARPDDPRVKKIQYSAFIAGSSDLDARLRARDIESVLVAGTATNVCCESTARDAMMLDYRVVMLSDANAAGGDAEHAASLDNIALFFGDVMSVDEAVARLCA